MSPSRKRKASASHKSEESPSHKRKASASRKRKEDKKKAKCTICYEEINDERCMVCNYGHKFHNKCSANQDISIKECPLCRSKSIESCNGNYYDFFEYPDLLKDFLETKMKERRIAELRRELYIVRADIHSTQMAKNHGDPFYTDDSQDQLSNMINGLTVRRDEILEEIRVISDPNYKLSELDYNTYKYIDELVKNDWYGPSELGGKRSKRKSSKRRKSAKRKNSKKNRK